MDQLLLAFIHQNFSPEMEEEILLSFKLCNDFNYHQTLDNFIDIINMESYSDKDASQAMFLDELTNTVNYLLKQHTLVLLDTPLYIKNQVLVALCRLQDLESYHSVITTLESDTEPYTKLALILEEYCDLTLVEIMQYVETFDVTILDTLKAFIYKNHDQAPVIVNDPDILLNLRIFFKVFGTNSIAYNLLSGGFLLNVDLTVYLDFVGQDLYMDADIDTAKNILGLIYMSTTEDPIITYRNHSQSIFSDLNSVTKIEVHLLTMIAKHKEYLQNHLEYHGDQNG